MYTEVPFAKKPPELSMVRVSPERREWVRRESAAILAQNLILRDKTKEEMKKKMNERDKVLQLSREERAQRWMQKTKASPFAVDLVAEDERIYEENQIRTREFEESKNKVQVRRQKIKNQIILKALSEFSDLEALRREKRAILEEEQRLRALLALEKTTQNLKGDRLAAERAQKQRHEAKHAFRRSIYKDSLDQIVSEENIALRRKHNLPLKEQESQEYGYFNGPDDG